MDQGSFKLYEFPSIVVPGHPGPNEGFILSLDGGSAASFIKFNPPYLMINNLPSGSYPITVTI
jgi:hypothetical protein